MKAEETLLRQQIFTIRNDYSLTEDQKRHKIQRIFSVGKEEEAVSDHVACRCSTASAMIEEETVTAGATSTTQCCMQTKEQCSSCRKDEEEMPSTEGEPEEPAPSSFVPACLSCFDPLPSSTQQPTCHRAPHHSISSQTSTQNYGDIICSYENKKKCSRFSFACCNAIDCCHRCHMERHGCDVRPPRITSIVCDFCDMRQSPGAACQNPACPSVGAPFSEAYCGKCLVWTTGPMTHCDKCGTCRVGNAEELYHCDTCDACFLKQHRHRHRCVKSSLKDQHCPLCLECIHFSQKRCDILSCGHVAHFDCLMKYLSHNKSSTSKMTPPTCPTCRKCLLSPSMVQPYWDSIRAAIAQQPLPADWFPPICIGDQVLTPTNEVLLVKAIIAGGATTGAAADTDRVCVGTLVNSASRSSVQEEEEMKQKEEGEEEVSFPLSSLSKKEATVHYLCNDCTIRGVTRFHYFGLECVNCGSFNTTRI